jgi:hypothetical protein
MKEIDSLVEFQSKSIPNYDYHISFGSLPKIFNTNKDNIPLNLPYLKPTGSIDKNNFNVYNGYYKIGICWAGSPQHPNDKDRSCYLKYFDCFSKRKNVKLFSLQKELSKRIYVGKGLVDLTEGADNLSLVDMSDLMKDFNYTAAIIEALDLVITVDTSIAHLCGAMNKDCYVLIHENPDWRWGDFCEKSVWYPSLKLFRKQNKETWSDVLIRLNNSLNGVLNNE